MTSGKRTWLVLLGVAALSTACSSSGDGATGTGGKGGGSSGTTSSTGGGSEPGAGTSGGSGGKGSSSTDLCQNTGSDNDQCPPVAPSTGVCAPKGACCHRSANSVKEKALASSATESELEYRLNYVFTVNHDKTIGDIKVATLSIARSDNEEQSTLLRMKVPRKDGADVAGMGEFTNYVGRYNCNGTYSFYDDSAAPAMKDGGLSDDTKRWAPATVQAKYDPAKLGTKDYITIPWSEKANRKLQYVPFVKPLDFTYDWELVNQGFRLLDFKVSGDGRDCIGKRDGSMWVAGGKFELYTPMGPNNKQTISTIQESYCTLVAFGIVTDTSLNCETTPRCMPGASGCMWKKLPDALCPVTDGDIDMYGCHLGAKGNPNAEKDYPADADLKCTDAAPTEAQDPDKGVTTVGQCCDPLGASSTLPKCNSYRLINDVVAAAAEITDKREHGLEPLCK